MSTWTTRTLLDRALMLTAAEAGDFFNYEQWLILLNQAQDDMIVNTFSHRKTEEFAYTNVDSFTEPDDFLEFANRTVQFKNASGTKYDLEMLSYRQLQQRDPDWRTATTSNSPSAIVGEDFYVYPQPTSAGTLVLPYTYRPYYLSEDDDKPFGGLSRYVRFGEALSFYVANAILLPLNPPLAGSMWNIYEKKRGELREKVRENAQSSNMVQTMKHLQYDTGYEEY